MKCRSILLLALVGALAICLIGGCSAESIEQLKTQRQTVREVRAATTQAIEVARSEIELLPEGDPVRVLWEQKVKEYAELALKAEIYLARADAVVEVYETGELNEQALTDAIRQIGGPYGALAAGLLGVGLSIWHKIKRARAEQSKELFEKGLQQVVKGVEAALPEKTEDQKLKMAAEQDQTTKVLVEQIKAG